MSLAFHLGPFVSLHRCMSLRSDQGSAPRTSRLFSGSRFPLEMLSNKGFQISSLFSSRLPGRSWLPGVRVGNPEVRRVLAIAEAGGDAGDVCVRVRRGVLCRCWGADSMWDSKQGNCKGRKGAMRGQDEDAMWGCCGCVWQLFVGRHLFVQGSSNWHRRQAPSFLQKFAHSNSAPGLPSQVNCTIPLQ